MTVMAIAPLLGPTIGAQILAWANWQSIFWTLVAIGVMTFIAVLTLPESLPADKRERGPFRDTIAGYGELLANRQLLFHAAAIGFFYAGVFANIAGGAFAYISFYGLSPQAYGLVFSSGVIGLMGANIANARLVGSVGSARMLLIGTLGAAVFGTAALPVTAFGLGGVAGLIATQFLFSAMNGLILANGVAGALSSVQTRTGAASALIGAVQYGSGMVGSGLVGIFANGTPIPMVVVMALGGIGSLASAWWASRQGE
jgi:DHA1 family bicyclomycin/chloramphenicol resistance-like MFS transporter